ncbi:transposase [Nonomuraea aurantiaca]|uniref:transposase n=1 Tax=Nonomuraea aurantiaca TaxID=2878562 RepID=UPI003FD72125
MEPMSNMEIAAHIGRDPSVVCREVKRHGGRQAYRAHRAERDAAEQRKRPKCRKLDADLTLREQVVAGLCIGWSPEQIAGRLRREPDTATLGRWRPTRRFTPGCMPRPRVSWRRRAFGCGTVARSAGRGGGPSPCVPELWGFLPSRTGRRRWRAAPFPGTGKAI